MAAVPNCATMHSSPAMTEDVIPGDNSTLQNVVVYLKGDFSRYSFDPPNSTVTIDQKGCGYMRRLIGVSNLELLSGHEGENVRTELLLSRKHSHVPKSAFR